MNLSQRNKILNDSLFSFDHISLVNKDQHSFSIEKSLEESKEAMYLAVNSSNKAEAVSANSQGSSNNIKPGLDLSSVLKSQSYYLSLMKDDSKESLQSAKNDSFASGARKNKSAISNRSNRSGGSGSVQLDLSRVLEQRYVNSIHARMLSYQQAMREFKSHDQIIAEVKQGEQDSLERVIENAAFEFLVKRQ